VESVYNEKQAPEQQAPEKQAPEKQAPEIQASQEDLSESSTEGPEVSEDQSEPLTNDENNLMKVFPDTVTKVSWSKLRGSLRSAASIQQREQILASLVKKGRLKLFADGIGRYWQKLF